MGVSVQREGRIGMTQNTGQGFGVHAAGERVGGESMPIGYNKDKSGIPVFSRGCGFVLVLFPLKKSP